MLCAFSACFDGLVHINMCNLSILPLMVFSFWGSAFYHHLVPSHTCATVLDFHWIRKFPLRKVIGYSSDLWHCEVWTRTEIKKPQKRTLLDAYSETARVSSDWDKVDHLRVYCLLEFQESLLLLDFRCQDIRCRRIQFKCEDVKFGPWMPSS